MKTTIKILRWVAVIPVAVISSILAYFIFYYCQDFFSDPKSTYMLYVAPVIGNFISGILFNYYGSLMAPDYNSRVSLGLLLVSCVFFGIIGFLNYISSEYLDLFCDVGFLAGCLVGYFYVTTSAE